MGLGMPKAAGFVWGATVMWVGPSGSQHGLPGVPMPTPDLSTSPGGTPSTTMSCGGTNPSPSPSITPGSTLAPGHSTFLRGTSTRAGDAEIFILALAGCIHPDHPSHPGHSSLAWARVPSPQQCRALPSPHLQCRQC